MADGDSEVVFGRGRPMPEEPAPGVNLFGHNGRSDSAERGHNEDLTVEEVPMKNSTPLMRRSAGQGDNPSVSEGRLIDRKDSYFPKPPKMVIRPESYEGKGDWDEYLSHFTDCARLGNWEDSTKCLVLAASLRGAARKYYTGLRPDEKESYISLTAALKRRFGGEHRQDSWLSKLEMRKRKSGESVSELGDDIWQMTQRAYFDFDYRSQEQLALKHFYRVIDADMKVKCIENKCSNILDAVNIVERYDALYEDKRESRRTTVRAVESKPDASFIAMERILEQLEKLEVRQAQCESRLQNRNRFARRNTQNQNVTCFGCGEKGHYKSSCPHEAENSSTNYRPSMGNDYPSN